MVWKKIINREQGGGEKREDTLYLNLPYLEEYFSRLIPELNLRLLCDESVKKDTGNVLDFIQQGNLTSDSMLCGTGFWLRENLLWVDGVVITAFEPCEQALLGKKEKKNRFTGLLHWIKNAAEYIQNSLLELCGKVQSTHP